MTTSKFYLQNENGGRICLTVGESEYFFTEVDGLGSERDDEFYDNDLGFYTRIKEHHPQQQIVGTVRFFGNAYQNYRTVSDFIHSAAALSLVYVPYGTTEFYRDVTLASLTKGNRTSSGAMECVMTLNCLSAWYNPVQLRVDFNGETYNPFRYDSSAYDGTEGYASSFAGTYSAEVTGAGHLPSALEISLTGYAVAPEIVLFGEDGGEIGRCSYSGDLASGETFVLNTGYGSESVTVDGGDVVADVDISENIYFRVPVGETCTLRILSSDTIQGAAVARVKYYYRSI